MAIQKTTLVAEGKFIQNVEGLPEVERMIKALQTLQSLSKNNEMARYWGTQEDMIDAVRAAYDKFNQSVRNGFSSDSISKSALELVNTSNALKSIYKDFNFSEINSKFNSVINDAIKRTEGMRNIIKAEDFTSVLAPIQEAVNSLGAQVPGLETKFESASAMAKQLFQSADSSRLRNELALAESALTQTENELRDAKIELNNYQTSDVGELRSQISSLNREIDSLQTQKVEQFVTALRSLETIHSDQAQNLLDGYSIETWDDIKGEYSSFLEFVNEAVNMLRSDPDYSVVDAISRAKQSILGDGIEIDTSAFDKVIQKIEQLESKLKESAGVMGGSEFSSGTEQIRNLVDTLSAGGGGSGPPPALDTWIEFLRSLDGLSFEEKIIPLQRLVNTMQQDVSVSSSSLQKVGEGLRAMTADLDTSKLAILKSLNFDSLSSLKISSTVKHLNEQLAPFSNSVNVGNLEAISRLNFDNLQNLKLSKSQMAGLASFSNQTDFSSVIGSMEQMASRIEELFNRIGMSGEKAASDLVGSDAKIASSISKSTNQIDKLKMQFESLGLSDGRIDEVVASLAKLREAYKDGTLTYEVYDEAIRKVRLNLKDLGETAKTTARAQKEAADEATRAAKEAEENAKKSATLSQDPEKLDQYITKFSTLEANIRKQLASWTRAKYGVSSEDYKNLERTADELGRVKSQLAGMTSSQADAAFKRMGNSAKQFGNNIKIAGEDTQTFTTKLGVAIKRYATFFTGMHAFMRIVQYGRQAVKAITDIDYAMNQLEIVSRRSNAELNEYADNIINIADKTAGSITELIDATTTYARLGYSLEDSTTLANLTQMLQNVGNIDASSAQNAITAIIKAFDIDVNNMEGVLDRMVMVGNNFPISVSQLAEGLNNASSILSVATNYQDDSIKSFEKSAAMLTAANVTVQNVSKASTALRTVVARLRKMDTELDELGEVMTAADYDKITQALTKQNVSLTDQNGQLRDAYDILQELSVAWKTMSANERSALAQTFGSTRNQNVFISLMENFDEAEKALKSMEDSENALAEANAIYLESIKAHIQQFKNTFETMFYSEGMVDFVNGVIDAGKSLLKLIEGITKVINFLGGLRTILPIVGGLLSNLITTKLISGFTKFISNIRNIGLIFSSLRTQVSSYAISQNAANAAMNTGATAASALASALGMIGMALGAANLVVSVVNGIISLFKSWGYGKQDNKITILSNSEIKETNSNLTDLYKQYIDLAGKISITSEEQDTLRGITEQLSTALGGEIGAIDFAKDSIDDYTQSVRDAIRAKQDLLIIDAVENMREAEAALTNYVPVGSELRKNNTDLFNWLPGAKNGTNLRAFINFTKEENDEIERQVELLREAGYEVDEYYNGYAYALNLGYVDATNIDSVTTYVNNLRGALLALSKTDISSGLFQSLKKELSFYDDLEKQYGESIQTISEQIASEAFIDTLDSGIDTSKLDEFREAVINNAIAIVDENSNVSMSTEEVIDAVDSLLQTIPELSSLYDDQKGVSDNIKTALSDIIDDIKEYIGDNDVIDFVFRPKLDVSALEDAGWDVGLSEELTQMYEDLDRLGVDASRTIFGNIDLNNRQLLEWTDANLEKYRHAIESWGNDVEDYAGTVSTVLGSLDTGHGIDIAFSPMLQTESGAVLLDADTFNRYLDDLITRAEMDDGSWTNEELFALDATGIEENGLLIKGLLADIGETADATSQSMHYLGNQGAIALEKSAEISRRLFAKTFNNKENTVAINFTPIVVDDYGNPKAVLTPKELEAYAKGVIDGTHEDDLNLMIGTKFEMDDGGAKEEAERVRENLESILSTLDPEFDLSNYENLIRTLTAVDTASNAASKALDDLNKKLKEPTYRQGMEARSDNYTKMMDLFEQGLIGDKDFQAYAEYYGIDLFNEENGKRVAKSYEEIEAEIMALMPLVGAYYDENGKLATDAELAMVNWLDAIDAAEDEYGDLISWDKEAEELKFDPSILFDSEKMKLIEEQFGITMEHFVDLLNEYKAHSLDWENFSNSDLESALKSSKLLEDAGDKSVLHVKKLEQMLSALGLDYDLIEDVVGRAKEISDIDIELGVDLDPSIKNNPQAIVDKINEIIAEINGEVEDNVDIIAELLSDLDPEIQTEVTAILAGDDGELAQQIQDAIDEQSVIVSAGTEIDEATSLNNAADALNDSFDSGKDTAEKLSEAAENIINAGVEIAKMSSEATAKAAQDSANAAIREKYGIKVEVGTDPAIKQLQEFKNQYRTIVGEIDKNKIVISVQNSEVSETNSEMGEIVSAIVTIDGHDPITIEFEKSDLEEPEELLEQLKLILAEQFGINLDDDEAQQILDALIKKIIKPETKEVGITYTYPETPAYQNDLNAPENQNALSNSQGTVIEPQYIEGDDSTYSIYEPKVAPVVDEDALNKITDDVEGAVKDADMSVGGLDTEEAEEAVIKLTTAAGNGRVVQEEYAQSLADISDQKIESSNKTNGIEAVSKASGKAQQSLDNAKSSVQTLSNTGVDTGNKVSPLGYIKESAYNVVSVFERLLTILRQWNNTAVQTKTLTVQTKYGKLAKGTRNAKAGLSLLGDEYNAAGQPRPELVVSDGEAYIAGADGPTFANLKAGDVVYPYNETKKILSRSSFAKFKAFAGGTIDYERIYKNVLNKTGGAAANYTDNSTTYNTYNYNAGSNSASDSEDKYEWVDWIEVIIDRAERAVKDFKQIAESTYNSLKKRLTATGNEIKAITNEIDIQERAYERYIKQANAVGLSSDLAQLVRDGTIDIRQYDEATRELIDDYKNWYDKALSCADAVAELHENLASLYEDRFENIQTDYENQLERFSFLTNEYNNYGRVISREHNQNIDTLRNELKDLEKAFSEAMASGEIQSQSEAWYGMVKTIQDVRDQISEMYEQVFSDIQSNYDNQISILDHFKNSYENAMDQMEAKGRLASTRFYSSLSDIEKQNINIMQKELNRLESTLSEAVKKGEIETYSEAWYSMRKEIDGVKESIEDANLQLLEYAKSMRELDWSHFDYMQDRISKLNEETEFLINLMSNDNLYQDSGQFNREGLATLGLRVQNYDVDMAQADAYAAEIKKVNKEIAKDKYNTELIERREELLNLQRESILAAESEKNAIKDLVEDGIKIELDNLKELIDTYKESIDSAKDLYEYNKNIAAQTKNIASLEKQLNAYQNDTSEETRTKVQKLRVELDDARQKLQETQYDRFVSDSKKMLDNLYDEYSDLLNSRLDDIDQLVLDMIDTVNTNSYDIKSTLYEVSDDVGYTMTTELKNVWNSANAIATYYGENFTGQLTTVNNTLNNIRTFVEALVKNSDKEADRYISGTASSTAATDKATASGGSQRSMTTTPSASSASSSTLSLSRNLSYGSKGDDVKKLQQRLYDLGYLNAAPDGIFGSYTLAAVNAFQMANGIGVDGIVGPKTLEKLNGSPIKKQNAKSTTFNYSKNLSYNSKGSDVAQLQKRLAELGYYAGYIDGNFGSQTLQAVKDFQKANGIYVDGIVGKTTTKYLNGNPKLGKYMRYATGGLVTSTGMAHLDGTPQKPELVLNAEDTRNFIALKDILSDMSSPLRLASISNFSHLLGGGLGSGIGNVINGGINIRIDHVEDYNDFVNQLRQDHQFERLIQSMTTDRIAGRSSLNKNNYRW